MSRVEVKQLDTCRGCSNFINTGCGTTYYINLKRNANGIIQEDCQLPVSATPLYSWNTLENTFGKLNDQ